MAAEEQAAGEVVLADGQARLQRRQAVPQDQPPRLEGETLEPRGQAVGLELAVHVLVERMSSPVFLGREEEVTVEVNVVLVVPPPPGVPVGVEGVQEDDADARFATTIAEPVEE